MNDDAIKGLSEAELAKHIQNLESQSWLEDLRSLQPVTPGLDFYALGYAAGQQAVPKKQGSLGKPLAFAAFSSALSMAATILLMWQLLPNIQRSSVEPIATTKETANKETANKKLANDSTVPQTMLPALPERQVAADVPNLDDLLLSRRQLASSSILPDAPLGINNDSASATIESDRTRYVTQRERWLSELASDMPN